MPPKGKGKEKAGGGSEAKGGGKGGKGGGKVAVTSSAPAPL